MNQELNVRDILRLAVRHRLVPAIKLPEIINAEEPLNEALDQGLLARADLARLLDAVRQTGPQILPKRPSPEAEDAVRAIADRLLSVQTALSWLQQGKLGPGSSQTVTWKQDSVGELPTRTSGQIKPLRKPGE